MYSRHSHSKSIAFVRLPVSVTVLLLIAGCTGRNVPVDLHVIEGTTMGTYYVVKIVKNDSLESISYASIDSIVNERLLGVNQQMSTYMEESELSRFNRYRGTEWFPVSRALADVFKMAGEVSSLSNGAFNITAGPLINLWGFGPDGLIESIPTDEVIAATKALVDYRKIAVRTQPPAVKKDLPAMYCDLSAIAKGYGVDVVALALDSLGISSYMVDIGGEISTKGLNASGRMWRIGIETPDASAGIQKIIAVEGVAMATSGDYRNYFERDGIRYSHTIDPETGRPITHQLASVTVLHKTCMEADAMATAINVLGPVDGYELAVKEELPVFLIVRERQGFTEKMTPAFRNYLAGNND